MKLFHGLSFRERARQLYPPGHAGQALGTFRPAFVVCSIRDQLKIWFLNAKGNRQLVTGCCRHFLLHFDASEFNLAPGPLINRIAGDDAHIVAGLCRHVITAIDPFGNAS